MADPHTERPIGGFISDEDSYELNNVQDSAQALGAIAPPSHIKAPPFGGYNNNIPWGAGMGYAASSASSNPILPRVVKAATPSGSIASGSSTLEHAGSYGLNIISVAQLEVLESNKALLKYSHLHAPLVAVLANNEATIAFHDTVTASIVTTGDKASSDYVPVTFHVYPDHDVAVQALLGWPTLQRLRVVNVDSSGMITLKPSAVPFAQSTNVHGAAPTPTTATLQAVPTRASQSLRSTQPVNASSPPSAATATSPRNVDLSLYPPPTTEELAAIDADNERAFADLRARFVANEPKYVNKSAYNMTLSAIDRLKPRFSTMVRPSDVVRDVHVPIDRLQAGKQLPHLPSRFGSPARMAMLRKWGAYYMHAGVIRPASRRGRAPAPSFIIGAAPKERTVHDTSELKDVFMAFAPPDLTPDEKLTLFSGFHFGSKLDITKAFYGVECNPNTPEELRQISIGGDVFTSNRLIMGSPNSSSYLIHVVHQVLGPLLYNPCVPTADDIAIPACGDSRAIAEMRHARAICDFAERTTHHNLTLNPNKCEFYTEALHYCGNIITSVGITRAPDSAAAIQTERLPKTGGELASLYYGAQWCSKHLPDFARRYRKLKRALEAMYKDSDERTSKSISKKQLHKFGITDDDVAPLVRALRNLALTAHRRAGWSLVLMTDASDEGYGGVLLQVPAAEIHDFMDGNSAEPLAFFGGVWDAAQSKYPMHELEGLAVLKCINSAWYIINDGTELCVLTDNKSLSALFAENPSRPYSKEGPGRNRIARWQAAFKEVNATIHHVPGVDNYLADLFSRAGVHADIANDNIDHGNEIPDTHPVYISALHLPNAVRTVSDPDWRAPSVEDIAAVHGTDGTLHEPTNALVHEHGLVWDATRHVFTKGNLIFVPDADSIRTKLTALAHCDIAGHHGTERSLNNLQEHFWWPSIKRDVHNFIQSCIHCMAAITHNVKRPYGAIVRGQRPNQVVSLDYVFVEESDNGFNRILIITDTFTNYSLFELASSESAEDALETIRVWCALFGTPSMIVTDSSPAFTSDLLQSVAKALGPQLHITTPKAHGAHGRQEALNAVVVRMLRSLLSEYRLSTNQWPMLVDLLCSSFNNTPVPSLAGYAPIELFTGLPRANPVSAVFHSNTKEPKWLPVDDNIHFVLERHAAELHAAAEFRTTIVQQVHERHAQQRAERRLREPGVKAVDFTRGDWVLVRRHTTRFKFDPQWQIGRIAHQINPAHPFLWMVQLESKDPSRRILLPVHADRIAKFASNTYARTPELLDLADYYENKKYLIESITGLRRNRSTKRLELLVKWLHYPDATWTDFVTMYQDLPASVDSFLEGAQLSKTLRDQAHQLIKQVVTP